MDKYNHRYTEDYRPISAWGYVGYSLLFAIPVVGLVLLIIFSFNENNYNRRNYARSYFCWLLILVLVTVITLVLSGSSIALFSNAGRYFNDAVNKIKALVPFSQTEEDNYVPFQNMANLRVTNESNSNNTQTQKIAPTSIPSPTQDNIRDSENNNSVNSSTGIERTLREGKYIIGKDIPAGNYTITCTGTAGEAYGDAYGSLGNVMDVLDGNTNGEWGNLYGSLGNLAGQYLDMTVEIIGDYGDVLRSYNMKNGDSLTIKLEEKTALRISDGNCAIKAE